MKYLFLLLFSAIGYVFSFAAMLPDRASPGNFTFNDDQFEVGQRMLLKIEYTFDKTEITANSRMVLDSVAVFMKCYPQLIFQVENHTDSRGNDKCNSDLTLRRAQGVVNYLINKGIDPARVVATGMGEEELLFTDAYIKANAKNKVYSIKKIVEPF